MDLPALPGGATLDNDPSLPPLPKGAKIDAAPSGGTDIGSFVRTQLGATGDQPYGEGAGYAIDNPVTRGLGGAANSAATGIAYLAKRAAGTVSPDIASSIDRNAVQPLVERSKQFEAPKNANIAELGAQTLSNVAGGISLAAVGGPETALGRAGTALRFGLPSAGDEAAQQEAAGKTVSATQLAEMGAANTAIGFLPANLGGGIAKRLLGGAAIGVGGNELTNAAAGNDVGTGDLTAGLVGAGFGALHTHAPVAMPGATDIGAPPLALRHEADFVVGPDGKTIVNKGDQNLGQPLRTGGPGMDQQAPNIGEPAQVPQPAPLALTHQPDFNVDAQGRAIPAKGVVDTAPREPFSGPGLDQQAPGVPAPTDVPPAAPLQLTQQPDFTVGADGKAIPNKGIVPPREPANGGPGMDEPYPIAYPSAPAGPLTAGLDAHPEAAAEMGQHVDTLKAANTPGEPLESAVAPAQDANNEAASANPDSAAAAVRVDNPSGAGATDQGRGGDASGLGDRRQPDSATDAAGVANAPDPEAVAAAAGVPHADSLAGDAARRAADRATGGDDAGAASDGTGSPVPADEPAPAIPSVAGKTGTAYTGSNEPVPFHYAVVDGSSLTASHDSAGNENPNYPQLFQPRDRSSKESVSQISTFAKNLKPERLGESSDIVTGAPLVGPDGVVESGNGRVMAINAAPENVRAGYNDWLKQNADKFGIHPDALAGVKNPVLVRVRNGDMSANARERIGREGNRSTTLAMNPTEVARSDAKVIDDGLMEKFNPSDEGDVLAGSNQDFLRGFAKAIGANEAAGMTADGKWTKQMADRVNAAVFAKAYGDDRLLHMQASSADPVIKNVLSALSTGAREFALAKSEGSAERGLDPGKLFADAAGVLVDAKQKGMTLDALLGQGDMLGGGVHPEVAQVARWMADNTRSHRRLGNALLEVGRDIRAELQSRQTEDMLGGKDRNLSEIVNRGIESSKERAASQPGLFGADRKPVESDRQGERAQDSGAAADRFESGTVREGAAQYGGDAAVPAAARGRAEPGTDRGRNVDAAGPVRDQLDLFVPAGPKKAEAVSAIKSRVDNVVTGHFSSGIKQVKSWQDAAHIVAPLRKSAQENVMAVVLDKDGKPLAVIRHSLGKIAESSVDIGALNSAIANTPGAKSVYYAHNHPSGSTDPSLADHKATLHLGDGLEGTGIEPKGMLVVGPGSKTAHFISLSAQFGEKEHGAITAAARGESVPVTERVIRKVASVGAEKITSPSIAVRIAGEVKEPGIMLINHRGEFIGHYPMTSAEMSRLRAKDANGDTGAKRALAEIGKANAASIMVVGDRSAINNVARWREQAMPEVRMLDGIEQKPDGSLESTRGNFGNQTTFYSRGDKVSGDSGRSATQVKSWIADAVKGWGEDAPKVVVHDSHEAASVPEHIKGSDGFDKSVEGAIDGDTIHLFANRLATRDDASRVLAHEAVGHYGVEKVLGDKFGKLVDDVNALRANDSVSPATRAVFDEVAKRYPGADADTFARESVAIMAEKGVKNSLMDRVIAGVQKFIRNTLGFQTRFSEAEVRRMIVDAHNRVGGDDAPRAPKGPQFSRAEADAHQSIKDIFDRYDSGDGGRFMSENDVVDELEHHVGNMDKTPPELQKAIDDYRDDAEEDQRDWGGRGDMEGAFDKLRAAFDDYASKGSTKNSDVQFSRAATADDFTDKNGKPDKGFIGKTVDAIGKAFTSAPADVAREDNRNTIRAALAERDRAVGTADAAVAATRDYFDKRPSDVLADPTKALADVIAYQQGKPIADPVAKAFFDKIGDTLQTQAEKIQGYGKGYLDSLVTNYFPQQWKDPAKADAFYTNLLAKRPIGGDKKFTKQRVYEDYAAGIAAGLEPISHNPVDMYMARYQSGEKLLASLQIMHEMEQRGTVRSVKQDERVPAGYARVNDPTFNAKVVPELIAKDLNNYLDPGLTKFAGWRNFRYLQNVLLSSRLGLSAFHAGMTTLDTLVSHADVAWRSALAGDLTGAMRQLGKVVTSPILSPIEGHKLLNEFYGKSSSGDANTAAILDALTQGGARGRMNPVDFNNDLAKFKRAWNQGDLRTATLKAIPAAIESTTHLIAHHLVPAQKMTARVMLMKFELDRLAKPLGTAKGDYAAAIDKLHPDKLREIAYQINADVDDRLGQFAYDNIFLNKTVRDALHASVQSVGWNFGTIRLLLGGTADARKLIKPDTYAGPLDKAGTLNGIQKSRLTTRLGYLITLNAVVASMGAITQQALTGEGPQELKDYFFPKTGRKNADDSDERIKYPSYVADEFSFAHHPIDTAVHKLHPIFSMLGEILKNKDFYGTQIYDPEASIPEEAKQFMGYLGKSFLPYAVSGAQKNAQAGAGFAASALPFIGITPASGEISKSPFQEYTANKYYDSLPQGARTQEKADQSAHYRSAVEAIRQGKQPDTSGMTQQQISGLRQRANTPLPESSFQKLGLVEKLHAYDLASAKERKEYKLRQSILKGSGAAISKLPPEQRQEVQARVNAVVAAQ